MIPSGRPSSRTIALVGTSAANSHDVAITVAGAGVEVGEERGHQIGPASPRGGECRGENAWLTSLRSPCAGGSVLTSIRLGADDASWIGSREENVSLSRAAAKTWS